MVMHYEDDDPPGEQRVTALVPVVRWADFTSLPGASHIEMRTEAWLAAGDEDAALRWMELHGESYQVELRCDRCGAVQRYVACLDADCGEWDEGFALQRLDERMRPFVERHAGCRWQMRMALNGHEDAPAASIGA